MNFNETAVAQSPDTVFATNKLIRNTYTLLSMTLIFSAVMAVVSMAVNLNPMVSLISLLGAFGLIWLVLPRTANSGTGIVVVFAITGLLGVSIGPMLNSYMALSNGPQLIATAAGGTGVIFLALSGYTLISRKDFSFMGGFLATGMIVILVAMLANIFMDIPALQLAISSAVIMIMSGYILYDTSHMLHNPNANYIMMTAHLFLSIFNIFIHLLSLLGVLSGDD